MKFIQISTNFLQNPHENSVVQVRGSKTSPKNWEGRSFAQHTDWPLSFRPWAAERPLAPSARPDGDCSGPTIVLRFFFAKIPSWFFSKKLQAGDLESGKALRDRGPKKDRIRFFPNRAGFNQSGCFFLGVFWMVFFGKRSIRCFVGIFKKIWKLQPNHGSVFFRDLTGSEFFRIPPLQNNTWRERCWWKGNVSLLDEGIHPWRCQLANCKGIEGIRTRKLTHRSKVEVTDQAIALSDTEVAEVGRKRDDRMRRDDAIFGVSGDISGDSLLDQDQNIAIWDEQHFFLREEGKIRVPGNKYNQNEFSWNLSHPWWLGERHWQMCFLRHCWRLRMFWMLCRNSSNLSWRHGSARLGKLRIWFSKHENSRFKGAEMERYFQSIR